VLLVNFIVESLPIPGNLDGKELHPEHEDRVVRREFLAGIGTHQGSIRIVVQLVELLGELAPLKLLHGGFEDVIAEPAHLKIWEILPEGGIYLVVVGRELQLGGMNAGDQLQGTGGFVVNGYSPALHKLTLK